MPLNNILKVLVVSGLFLVAGISTVQAAISPEHEVVKNSPFKAQDILYRISSSDLETLKNSLMQINLHMREGVGKVRPNIKIVIHGEGAKFLYSKNMDSELKYMLDWFLAENVKFGICDICQETFGIDLKAFPEGFVNIEN